MGKALDITNKCSTSDLLIFHNMISHSTTHIALTFGNDLSDLPHTFASHPYVYLLIFLSESRLQQILLPPKLNSVTVYTRKEIQCRQITKRKGGHGAYPRHCFLRGCFPLRLHCLGASFMSADTYIYLSSNRLSSWRASRFNDGRVCELVETLLKYYRSLLVDHFTITHVQRTNTSCTYA